MARRPDPDDSGKEPDERFTLANERTFLAWIRTALALIGGGLAAGQLLEFETEAARLAVALPPIVLGAVLALTSYRRWLATQRALRLGRPLPDGGLALMLAVGVGAVAVVVAATVMIDALGR
jgi:putative membrane protein